MIEIKTTSTDILFDDDTCDFRNITAIKNQPETQKIEPVEYKHIGKIYTDYSGKILCVTNYTKTPNDKMRMHITKISLKKRQASDYIVPAISELFPKYNPRAHYERIKTTVSFNPTIIDRQYELAELLKIDGAKNPVEIKSGAVSVRLLDRLAVIMRLEEFKNPWYVSESGRRYESQDM